MKIVNRVIALVLILLSVISFNSCYYRHELNEDLSNYHKIFSLGEFTGTCGVYLVLPKSENEQWKGKLQNALETYGYDEKSDIIPPTVDDINVIDFFCNETQYFVGSDNIEFLLSVKYDQVSFSAEIERLSKIAGWEKMVYDTEHFAYPAYVSILGLHKINQYVLIDEENSTLHYIYLQFCLIEEMERIPAEFLPIGYYDGGYVEEIEYSIFHTPHSPSPSYSSVGAEV